MDNKESPRKITYHAYEPYPVPVDILTKLNYKEFLEDENSGKIFKALNSLSPEKEMVLESNMTIKMLQREIQDVSLDTQLFNLVYFDAFGPEVHPEMWQKQVFQKLYDSMKRGAVLLTFSVKGVVKRNLIAAGFSLELLPGPPGKRHILRAKR